MNNDLNLSLIVVFFVMKKINIVYKVFSLVYYWFYRFFDVYLFGIWRNLLFKVFVRKNIDEKRVKKELMKINSNFFEKFRLEIEKRILV